MSIYGETANKIVSIVLKNGADKAEALDTENIVLSDTFRELCEKNSCGHYNACYMCPPDVGDIHELMDKLRTYNRAVLYQTIHSLEDSFDVEGMGEGKKRHVAVQRAAKKAVDELTENLHLGTGGCGLCAKCARIDNLACRFPDDAVQGMDCYGVDVYQTTTTTGLKYINGQNTVTYFGMILWNE